MNNKEILQKLFYIDKLYEEERIADKSNSEIEEAIKAIKKKVSPFTKEEIRSKLSQREFVWFDRLNDKYCKLIEVPLDLLCLDDFHGGLERGVKLKNSSKMNSQESVQRVSSLYPIVDSILSQIPIIVRKYGELFEVILGNHRAMCLIKKGVRTHKILVICDNEDEDTYSSLDFT